MTNNYNQQNPIVSYMDANISGRDFIIGDLHGCWHLLVSLLEAVKFDYEVDRLFCVGDLVDRGKMNEQCLELLTKKWFFCVLGNHEDLTRGAMLWFLHLHSGQRNHSASADYLLAMKQTHMHNGGQWLNQIVTSQHLSLDDKKAYCEDNIKLINALPYVLVVGTGEDRFNIVHSELIRPGVPMSDALLDNEADKLDKEILIWDRTLFSARADSVLTNPDMFQAPELSITYSGHTPLEQITQRARQINIDTCAFYADFISADRNGTHGLTIINPKTKEFLTVNGASEQITTGIFTNQC